ncbi:MAG: type IV toxin-antitoxin system AbiEi family antitoxin [Nitrospinae bacterium]|jgi:hypothetical protein|nr:type IV toxin-antitoxin system AbiEi family antitoxin [Nitrospinota bacterium]MDA1110176.1 type IV toxin-antitoxin system AbiEi family antitoxin [Nitrospinota bacterium]
MGIQNEIKIQKLLQKWPQGTVAMTSWLESLGISRQLQKKYVESQWIKSLARGAYKKTGDNVSWQGGLYALQMQASILVHVGALTALSMQGMAHYIRLGKERIFLLSPPRTTLPSWFRNHDWQQPVKHIKTSVLPEGLGLTDYEEKTFSIKISSPERAMLECLQLAPRELDLVECYQVMEGLTNLRPKKLQELLEKCSSIKVKRLFLYMAEKTGHQWMQFLNVSKLNLGKGDRAIVENGVYISKYHISIPKELANS